MKQLSLFILLAVTSNIVASCQENKTNPADQRRDSAIQKLTSYRQAFRDSLPKPTGYVNDYENIYSDKEERILDSIMAGFEKTSSIQVTIVSFDSSMIEKDSLDAMTLKIANEWGVGEKYQNNGVTIGICIGHRKMRIQNGFGIEKILTNNETQEIVNFVFLPAFSNGLYFKGTLDGLNDLITRLRKNQVQQGLKN